jgi:hypothetical protein
MVSAGMAGPASRADNLAHRHNSDWSGFLVDRRRLAAADFAGRYARFACATPGLVAAFVATTRFRPPRLAA